MSSHGEVGRLPEYDSDKAALERAGKKEVLKVCLQQLRLYPPSSYQLRAAIDVQRSESGASLPS